MDEFISREVAISIFDAKAEMAMGTPKECFHAAVKMIEKLPAADVKPVVHGKWTLNRDGSGKCNECGITQKNVWDDDTCQRYCGICGARMDGE